MKKIICLLAFMMVSCFLASSVFAEEIYIPCPLKEARTEMVSPLSDGWWQTPQVWPLESVRTQIIGGEPTLVCLYRAYECVVPVMHLYPKGMDCSPKGQGFWCTSGVITPPPGREHRQDSRNQDRTSQDKTKYEQQRTRDKVKKPTKVQNCPDPAVVQISMPRNWISFSGDRKIAYFRLTATVQNMSGEGYFSGANQQTASIYEITSSGNRNARTVKSFKDLKPKESITLQYDVTWPLSGKDQKKNPKYFEVAIAYDPDIRTDGNTANDDCDMKNNSRRMTAGDIEKVLNEVR